MRVLLSTLLTRCKEEVCMFGKISRFVFERFLSSYMGSGQSGSGGVFCDTPVCILFMDLSVCDIIDIWSKKLP